MIIKKLEIHGFKSFPERTKILFHPGITAIIGPNGTGKSNIIDAILWVLGGTRQKALRGERTEDIIFNGNNRRAALGMAEVLLTLEEGNEELVISHRLFRSGESEYRLNGKPVRLRDIQETLWKKEVAEKDYYIIEQGSIGLLLTSKPQEKRQLLEEAAGTAFYKEKKRQAQLKLEDTEQNLTRLEDIISEVARLKNSLARQAAAARRYRQLRERIRELRSLMYLKKLNLLEERKRDIASAYQNCLEEEKICLNEIKSLEKKISSLRQELWEAGQKLEQEREDLHSLEKHRQKLEAEKETRRIDFLEERKRQASEEIKQLVEERDVIEQELNLLKSVEIELEEGLKDKLVAFNQARKEWVENDEIRRQIGANLQKLRDEHMQKVVRLTEAKNKLSRLEKELELSCRQENKLRTQIKRVSEELQIVQAKINEIKDHMDKVEKDKKLREKNIERLSLEREALNKQLEKIEEETREKQEKIEVLTYEIKALKKIIESSASQLEAEIPVSWGKLIDLLSFDPGSGRLLDTFLGEAAHALVIPAEALINKDIPEFKGKLFILPNSRPTPKLELPNHPEIVGWLKSSIHPRDPLTSRWSWFPDAIIVRTLRTAIELWLQYPNLNFITLKGEVLLSNGLIKVSESSEGLFALKEEEQRRHQDLLKIEEEMNPLLEKLNQLKKEITEIEKALEKEREESFHLEKKLKEIEKDLARLKMEESQLLQNADLFQKELELLLQEQRQIKEKVNPVKEEINLVSEEERVIREKISASEQFLEEKEKSLNLQTQRLMELKSLVEIEETKKGHLRRQMEDLEQRKLNLNQKIHNLSLQIEAWEKEEKDLKQFLEKIAEDIKSVAAKIEKKKEEMAALENRYGLLRKENEIEEKRIAELRSLYEKKKDERIRQEIARTEIERDLTNLSENCWQELRKTLEELKAESPQKEMFIEEIEAELEKAEEELQKFKAVNLMAEEEYQQQKERYDFLITQRNDLRQSIEATREAIDKIDEESKRQFLQALDQVNRNFQEIFNFLFRGGLAEVRLTNPENPLESGVEIMAQPPGKKLQNINLLSGGEKSLTSLAFLFALFRTRPTPFCILDEVDAALDENNISRFLDLMEEMKSTTQFIIVTHNYKTMEVADYIYGTTMEEPNVTSLYSVRLEKKQEASTLS